MANEEQLSILKQGVDVWNKWRSENPDSLIDLSGVKFFDISLVNIDFRADLEDANLEFSDFSDSLLYGVNFTKANLRETKFRTSNLNGANLSYTNLSNADLSNASLKNANLSNSYLYRTILTEVEFDKAILSKTIFAHTIFGFNDLSNVRGIEKAKHTLPSPLSLDTIYLSKGKIPEIFLRGCGLTDLEIEYAKLANPGLDPEQVTDITYKIHQLYLGGGIQYYSCFISYNSKDEAFARQLHDDLQNNGVRCWFAPEDLKIGDQIRPKIDQEIRMRDKLLVILSENSIKSEWVGDEVEGALEEESKSNRLVLFPIRLDDTVLNTRDDWAAKIKRRRHIGDFSNWKDKASYQKAFEKLLKDLKATGGDANDKKDFEIEK